MAFKQNMKCPQCKKGNHRSCPKFRISPVNHQWHCCCGPLSGWSFPIGPMGRKKPR